MKRAQRTAGFSLLELVIVMFVLSIAVAVSYPMLSRGTASFQLRATGRDVLNTLRYARERAVTRQESMKVTLDRESQVVVLSDEIGDGARTYKLPKDVTIVGYKLAGQEITEGLLIIRFMPNGSSEDAEILLRSRTGSAVRIVTDPITGGARLIRASGDPGT